MAHQTLPAVFSWWLTLLSGNETSGTSLAGILALSTGLIVAAAAYLMLWLVDRRQRSTQ